MRASGYARVVNDWYVEPAFAVDALIASERPFEGSVVDPCCGGGNIPSRLCAAGVQATGSDIADRGYGATGVDFFASTTRCDSIVSNPPYDRAQEFIVHALSLTSDRVCVLLRLAFLEGQARRPWHEASPLARVWVSSRRLSMPPGGSGIKATGGTVAYAWFVYQHGFCGSPQIGWL